MTMYDIYEHGVENVHKSFCYHWSALVTYVCVGKQMLTIMVPELSWLHHALPSCHSSLLLLSLQQLQYKHSLLPANMLQARSGSGSEVGTAATSVSNESKSNALICMIYVSSYAHLFAPY